ncbi:MAG: hypothetical protein ACJAZ1_000405 [Yoonia sp.]|jgi:hypothetical protein
MDLRAKLRHDFRARDRRGRDQIGCPRDNHPPSGGAGIAAILAGLLELGPDAQVMAIISEGAEDA